MNRIAIISNYGRIKGGMNLLYPIYRWEKKFEECGVKFDIYTNAENIKLLEYSVIIIMHRYYQLKFGKGYIKDFSEIIEKILFFKKHGVKVVYFDTGDATGTNLFQLMEYVDLLLRKQLFKNKELYLMNNGIHSQRIWLLSNAYDKEVNDYIPCKQEYLKNVGLLWNIGLVDYRIISRYLRPLSNYFITKLKATTWTANRPYLTSFRGSVGSDKIYSFQRNYCIDHLRNSNYNVIVGPSVSRKKFLKEISQSNAVVSPYGWGEICYRDFETFIHGAILIKPDVSHLETFPNWYDINRTYLPIEWNMNDLENILGRINDNKPLYSEIAITGQEEFLKFYNDGDLFVSHVLSSLKSVI